MKNALLSIGVLAIGAAGLWHFYPEAVRPLVERTPLKKHVYESTAVYQWRDKEGNWQITGEPPPQGTPYEVKQYSLDTNIMPALRAAGEAE